MSDYTTDTTTGEAGKDKPESRDIDQVIERGGDS